MLTTRPFFVILHALVKLYRTAAAAHAKCHRQTSIDNLSPASCSSFLLNLSSVGEEKHLFDQNASVLPRRAIIKILLLRKGARDKCPRGRKMSGYSRLSIPSVARVPAGLNPLACGRDYRTIALRLRDGMRQYRDLHRGKPLCCANELERKGGLFLIH
ncbi:hypothetical protein PUN28_011697 [Cardiocondyla obscurior]|uniref:Secreted protein n=1 Tax=Cardiocondyla obscurior TaxID=286306 RepID=A0AAW2FIG6_9HYME